MLTYDETAVKADEFSVRVLGGPAGGSSDETAASRELTIASRNRNGVAV